MRSLVRYMRDARWPRQHVWRKAIWQAMGNVGLTGMHVLPVHKSWVDFAHYPYDDDPRIAGRPRGSADHPDFRSALLAHGACQLSLAVHGLDQRAEPGRGSCDRRPVHGRGGVMRTSFAHMLSRLKTSHGVLCILGNHDYGLNGKAMADRGGRRVAYLQSVLVEHGIQLLRNQSWRLRGTDGKGLTFVGLDDEWSGPYAPGRGVCLSQSFGSGGLSCSQSRHVPATIALSPGSGC